MRCGGLRPGKHPRGAPTRSRKPSRRPSPPPRVGPCRSNRSWSARRFVEHPLTLDRSGIEVAFDLVHRRKGLLWFPTYVVRFDANYTFKNPAQEAQTATVRFPLNRSTASRDEGASLNHMSFDDFQVTDADGRRVELPNRGWGRRLGGSLRALGPATLPRRLPHPWHLELALPDDRGHRRNEGLRAGNEDELSQRRLSGGLVPAPPSIRPATADGKDAGNSRA